MKSAESPNTFRRNDFQLIDNNAIKAPATSDFINDKYSTNPVDYKMYSTNIPSSNLDDAIHPKISQPFDNYVSRYTSINTDYNVGNRFTAHPYTDKNLDNSTKRYDFRSFGNNKHDSEQNFKPLSHMVPENTSIINRTRYTPIEPSKYKIESKENFDLPPRSQPYISQNTPLSSAFDQGEPIRFYQPKYTEKYTKYNSSIGRETRSTFLREPTSMNLNRYPLKSISSYPDASNYTRNYESRVDPPKINEQKKYEPIRFNATRYEPSRFTSYENSRIGSNAPNNLRNHEFLRKNYEPEIISYDDRRNGGPDKLESNNFDAQLESSREENNPNLINRLEMRRPPPLFEQFLSNPPVNGRTTIDAEAIERADSRFGGSIKPYIPSHRNYEKKNYDRASKPDERLVLERRFDDFDAKYRSSSLPQDKQASSSIDGEKEGDKIDDERKGYKFSNDKFENLWNKGKKLNVGE